MVGTPVQLLTAVNKKTSDDRHRVTKDHFMSMPDHRR